VNTTIDASTLKLTDDGIEGLPPLAQKELEAIITRWEEGEIFSNAAIADHAYLLGLKHGQEGVADGVD
jgi:hypothetical protein